jgi:hypothetical protein
MLAAVVIPVDHTRGETHLGGNTLALLNERSREIFRLIVDSCLAGSELSYGRSFSSARRPAAMRLG